MSARVNDLWQRSPKEQGAVPDQSSSYPGLQTSLARVPLACFQACLPEGGPSHYNVQTETQEDQEVAVRGSVGKGVLTHVRGAGG